LDFFPFAVIARKVLCDNTFKRLFRKFN
jgi:hypothetical protein